MTNKPKTTEGKGIKVKYCSYCGTKMLYSLVPADENICFHPNYGEIVCGSKYDTETGKANFCPKYTCPNYKDTFLKLNHHDNYILDEII